MSKNPTGKIALGCLGTKDGDGARHGAWGSGLGVRVWGLGPWGSVTARCSAGRTRGNHGGHGGHGEARGPCAKPGILGTPYSIPQRLRLSESMRTIEPDLTPAYEDNRTRSDPCTAPGQPGAPGTGTGWPNGVCVPLGRGPWGREGRGVWLGNPRPRPCVGCSSPWDRLPS